MHFSMILMDLEGFYRKSAARFEGALFRFYPESVTSSLEFAPNLLQAHWNLPRICYKKSQNLPRICNKKNRAYDFYLQDSVRFNGLDFCCAFFSASG
jgi:hypothetical protein